MFSNFIHKAGFSCLALLGLSACADAPGPGRFETVPVVKTSGTLAPTPLMTPDKMADHIFGAGDVLAVTVAGEDDLSGDYTIGQQGDIDLPLIGKIPAQGARADVLAETIESAYRGPYLKHPHVSVVLKQACLDYAKNEGQVQ